MHTVTIVGNNGKTKTFKARQVHVTKTRTWWVDGRGVRHYALHRMFMTTVTSN